MYNGPCNYLNQNKLIYSNTFCDQKGHSTSHAFLQLIGQITDSFNQNNFTLGAFVDLSKAFEFLSIEILNKETKKTILILIYKPPNEYFSVCETLLKPILEKKTNIKNFVLADDFKMNLLVPENNKKFQNFANLRIQYSMIQTINKPTRVTKNTATAIDYIIKNPNFNKEFKSDIV